MSGEGERASRPSSLQLEAPPPEREPLHFDVQLIGAPPEVEQLVNNIKQVAEDFLYHWKTFPIVLPPSRFTGPGNKPSDIIIPPPCDELDAAALDAGIEPQPLSPKQLYSIRDKGRHKEKAYKPKMLNAKQLDCIREWGEFEVPSRHFPGQTHVWRVAGWLQRGRVRAKEELYTHMARAAAVIVIVARDRLLRDEPLSVRAGATAFLDGLHRLLDLIIGLPSMEARDLDKKIREERSRYLVAELICKPEHQEDISTLAAWVSRAMRRAATEKADARELPRPVPRVPFLYTTPQRTQVDLRLYRRDVLRRAASTLQSILERESRGWFLHFRERHAAQLASQKMPLKDIEEEVRDAALREYVTRVCNAVLASEPLAALGTGIPELLAAQLRAAAITDRAEEGVRRRLEAGLSAAEARLRVSHPVMSRCGAWRRERLAEAERRLRHELRWAAHEDVAHQLETHRLPMHRYFLVRDLAFLRARSALLARELARARSATRRWAWRARVWRPARWRVTRHLRGRAERVPTVLSRRRASAAAPRSDPAHPVFLLQTDTIRETTTRWPGWRLANAYHRMWSWTWNIMFVLGVVVPWCSPLSLRTLIRATPYYPDYELSQVNGTLFPKRSSETHTMWSRLLALWRHVSKQRSRFETEPDTGLLGKGVIRAAHRVWQYGCVGALGSMALLLLLPAACILVSCASVLAAITAPVWVPPLALLAHAGMALFFDVDCPRPDTLNRWFPLLQAAACVCVLGLLQPLCALLLALVLCPLCSLALLVGGCVWGGLRAAWEAAAWRGVIARGARVPAHDSAFCRRVAGPAHAAPASYQLTCAQAVAAACARAEAEALAEWSAACERAIERPLRDYRHFVDACFGPFSVHIAKTGAYKQLERECAELVHSLREKVSARRGALALPLSDAARARCRLSPPDLTAAVEAGAAELARVWGAAARADEWWARRGLETHDYTALAANTLCEAFNPDILAPLEECAARLPLESGAGARAWEQRCARAAPPDLVAGAGAWGAGGAPRVPPPALDLQAFSPRAHRAPPLPHPATVALVLHNRDSDNPIPLDSELCAEIMKTLEDAPDSDDKRDTVERYRGGASSTGSSSDAEEEEERPEICRVERGVGGAGGGAVGAGGGACRWTLTGRGVRLRADLASPEDVTLDAERRGTSV